MKCIFFICSFDKIRIEENNIIISEYLTNDIPTSNIDRNIERHNKYLEIVKRLICITIFKKFVN